MKDEFKITKTELVWPEKRTKVEQVKLPFQTIEVINLPRGRRQESLFDLHQQQEKLIEDEIEQPTLSPVTDDGWKNRLIWGDNFLVMGSLLDEFAGKINLIYIDPPFATGQDFSYQVRVGDEEWTKEPSAIEELAYRDTWGKGLESYLQMMYDRLILMKELLADDGSIYVHLDWHVGHYIKLLLDEIFGEQNFLNEIIWKRATSGSSKAIAQRLGSDHDTILLYIKDSNKYKFNKQYSPYSKEYIETEFRYKDDRGRYKSAELATYSEKKLEQLKKENKLIETSGGKLRYKIYYDDAPGVLIDDIWTDLPFVAATAGERIGFPTQKPEVLLNRIINVSSDESDLIADFFAGSGTTGVVAEKLRRRWIMCDLGRFSIHTARKRLLNADSIFVLQNLGKYERHRWIQTNGSFKDYIKFILELYHAEPVEGFKNLHGKKGNTFVRIGTVDAPVTLTEIQETLAECKENNIKNLDVLGWEWEMGLHDMVKDEAERYGVKLKTLQIPREVMDVDPKTKEEVHFYELAYLKVGVKKDSKTVTITLEDFILENPELIPPEVREKIKNWSDFIDYWAVDWLFNQHPEQTEKDDVFHNMNQEYRTRKNPKLNLSMVYDYPKSGKYNILVKVIDIFGNDTTKMVVIKI